MGSLRARMVRDVDTQSSGVGDALLFLLYALPGLFGVIGLVLGVVTIARWL